MKPISPSQWNRYKESDQGKATIEAFSRIANENCSMQDIYDLAKKYNPQWFANRTAKDEQRLLECLTDINDAIIAIIDAGRKVETLEDAVDFYLDLIAVLSNSGVNTLDEIPQSSFKNLLWANLLITVLLYAYFPVYFIPNLFAFQFDALLAIADKYEIDIPKVPSRSDYAARSLYYIDLMCALIPFTIDNGITDMAEICAFYFDYEMEQAHEVLTEARKKPIEKVPNQAWLLVGNRSEGEKIMESGFWQANQFTQRGDLLLFYEKSPVKKMNAVWRALQDGVVDPFFHYYSYTYIGDKIAIPEDEAITFEQFKNDEYFKSREKKGNFVSKNFQDTSGWEVTHADYAEILHLLQENGYDTSKLPELFTPEKIGDVEINLEEDVTNKLLVPLLHQMGWQEGRDFEFEVRFRAGRGETFSEKRCDVCLHVNHRKADDPKAKVAIEVKKYMKNNEEIHENFRQGCSYAKLASADVLVTCDERQLRVHLKNKKGDFDEKHPIVFLWQELEDGDKFNQLRNLLA